MPDKNKQTEPDYDQMGRQLEALYHSVHPKRGVFYWTAFLKGVVSGVGGVIGATVVIALLLWLLSLLDTVPFIGPLVESTKNTLEAR